MRLILAISFLAFLSCSSLLDHAQLAANENRHPLSLIEADVYVNQKLTNMRLKMFAEDLQFFQGIEPKESGFYDIEELNQAVKDHAEYLTERITIRDSSGQLLKPKVNDIVGIELPEGEETQIFDGELMQYQIGYVFSFSHETPPEFLTFQQDVVDDDYLYPAEVKLLLKQAGSETKYMKVMKPGEPETIRFDWDRPPLSEEASEKEWSEWFDEQREKTLGIESYSSVYSFLYITEHEVRHEILIPLASLLTIVDLEREDEYFLDIPEQDKAKENIIEQFSVGNPITIDGVEVQPVFDRIDFYGLDIRDFAMMAERRKVSMSNGRVGLIMSYKTKGAPNNVSLTWDKFSRAITTIESFIFAYDKADRRQFSTYIEDNTFDWQTPGRPPLPELSTIELNNRFRQPSFSLPVASFICLGSVAILMIPVLIWPVIARYVAFICLALAVAGILLFPFYRYEFQSDEFKFLPETKFHDEYVKAHVDENADEVFNALHKNLFRAFDYYNEDDIYDALAKSVDGPFLRQAYLDIRKSLEVQQQGGAVSSVDEVNLIEGSVVEPLPENPVTSLGFAYRCKWNLVGTIEHWGHIHQRTNEYDAIFTVEDRDGEWKITSMEVQNQVQGPVKSSLRKLK